jgi:hypothetical protein
MANFPEIFELEDSIYQLEQTDLVLVGPGGIVNLQATQLGNRTWFRKSAATA